MNKKYQFTLKKKFTLFIIGFVLMFGIIFFVITARFQKNFIQKLFIQRNIALTKSYGLTIQNQLFTGNDLALDDVSQLYSQETGVISAYVLDQDNHYISHSNPDLLGQTHPLYKILSTTKKLDNYYLAINTNGTLIFVFYYPINNNLIAHLEIKYNAINKWLFSFFSRISIIFIFLFGLAIFFGQLIAGHLSKPIKELSKGVEIISEGNFDYQIKNPYNDEIGLLTNEFNIMTKKIKKIQELNILKERINRELEIAAEIQQMLIPQEKIGLKNYDIDYFYSPAVEIGGDYYDFFKMSDDQLGFVLADVSGKGIPAAIVMSMIKTIFSSFTEIKLDSKKVLGLTNILLRKNIKRTIFVPTFYGVLNTKTDELEFSMAGGEKAILFNKVTKKYKFLKTSGFPLGMQPDKEFRENLETTNLKIQKDECLLVYTDGLTDIQHHTTKTFFDVEGIIEFIKNYNFETKQFVNDLIKHINDYRGTTKQEDDITFILICKK